MTPVVFPILTYPVLPHFSIMKEHSSAQHQKQSPETSSLITNKLELFRQLPWMTLEIPEFLCVLRDVDFEDSLCSLSLLIKDPWSTTFQTGSVSCVEI